MMHNGYASSHTTLRQFSLQDYSSTLYASELEQHEQVVDEYRDEIYEALVNSCKTNTPNIEAFQQQPYLTFSIRLKLLDFLFKMSVRLKALPFVFYRAVKIFDRYCCKRIILLDKAQLIISTCFWIAAKFGGGNSHFINLNNVEKLVSVKTINDLGYGAGGKFKGPTERYRMPKLNEFIKLCGTKCNYTVKQFKQMELHILRTLNWSFNDPSIEEFIVQSQEFSILKQNELFQVKRFISYVSVYSFALMNVSVLDLYRVVTDLVNEILNIRETGYYHDKLCNSITRKDYLFIKQHLIKSIVNASDPILSHFNSRGPHYFHHTVINIYTNSFGSTLDPATNLTLLPKELFPVFKKNTPVFSNENVFISASSTTSSTASTILPVSSPTSTNTISTSYSYPSPGRYTTNCVVKPSSPESLNDNVATKYSEFI